LAEKLAPTSRFPSKGELPTTGQEAEKHSAHPNFTPKLLSLIIWLGKGAKLFGCDVNLQGKYWLKRDRNTLSNHRALLT